MTSKLSLHIIVFNIDLVVELGHAGAAGLGLQAYQLRFPGAHAVVSTVGVNSLKLLWPIEVGKSLRYPGKNRDELGIMRTISVTAKAEYWRPYSRTNTYAKTHDT